MAAHACRERCAWLSLLKDRTARQVNKGSHTRCAPQLMWGVAAVETSTSGHFYRHLPEAALLVGPEAGRSAAWALSQLEHLEDDETIRSVTISAGRGGQSRPRRDLS